MDALKKLIKKKDTVLKVSQVHYGQNLASIPDVPVGSWTPEIIAAFTGPNSGLVDLALESSSALEPTADTIAGTNNWNNPSEFAYGTAVSFYEEDRRGDGYHSPSSQPATWDRISIMQIGDPVADVFGIQVRKNSAILAVADGVSWGRKSRLSARCAVHAVMDHISSNLGQIETKPNSRKIAQLLLESVTVKAQDLILQHKATLTTLSAVVVCELATKPGEWGVFVVSVGDSPVYVYCPHTQSTTEVTIGCHAHSGGRDPRFAGGTLGPSHGSRPDLENLTVAYMPVHSGDIVFCTSDGISDNFSSNVTQATMGPSTKTSMKPEKLCINTQLHAKPCCDSIVQMSEVLTKHQEDLSHHLTAQTVVTRLINHVSEVTDDKREFRSECLAKNIDYRTAAKDPEFSQWKNTVKGKLDHATVVAYEVGYHQ